MERSKPISLEQRMALAARRTAFFDVHGVVVRPRQYLPSKFDTLLDLHSDTWRDWGRAAALISAATGDPYGLHPPEEFGYFEIVTSWNSSHFWRLYLTANFEEHNCEAPIMMVAQLSDASAHEVWRLGGDGVVYPGKLTQCITSDTGFGRFLYRGAIKALHMLNPGLDERDISALYSSADARIPTLHVIADIRHALNELCEAYLSRHAFYCPTCQVIRLERHLKMFRRQAPDGVGPRWVEYPVPVYTCHCCEYETVEPFAERTWAEVWDRYCSVFRGAGAGTALRALRKNPTDARQSCL